MPSKFRYYLIDDYLNVTGTNSIEVAKAAFFDGSAVAIDAQNGVEFDENGDVTDADFDEEPIFKNIPEHGADFPEAP